MRTPLKLQVRSEHASVPPGRSTTWAAIRIDPDTGGVERARAPLAVALVIDVSGSMSGDPIAHVLRSCEILADLLDEHDQLAVVTFGTHAGVRCGLTRVDAAGRAAIKAALVGVTVDGSTNLHGGMEVGAGVLVTAASGLRRVMVVMSDGQPNVGLSSAGDLAAYVASLRPIGASTLGFGLHHDENVLVAIAEAGSGRYAYVPDPMLARVDLARAALAHGGVVADELELTIALAEGVELVQILPVTRLRHGKGGVSASIGDVFVDEGRLFAVELALDLGGGAARGHLAEVTLAARTPGGPVQLTAPLAVDVRAGATVVDRAAQRDVVVVQAQAARVEAREQADRRATPAAVAILRRMVTRIDGLDGFVRDDGSELAELREQLEDEALNYERQSTDLERGHQRKAAMAYKYGVARAARQRPPVPAFLIGLAGPVAGQTFDLDADTMIGRSSSNAIPVQDGSVSRAHTRLVVVGDRFVVQDMGSTNGTLVNGRRVDSLTLASGDVISVGALEFRFELGTP